MSDSTSLRSRLCLVAAALVIVSGFVLSRPRRQSGDDRFHRARGRAYEGLGAAEEGAWRGGYHFVQLADPQLGMLRRDRSWAEELSMLRLAVDHVNRLRPRFVVVSGDLVNAFPGQDEVITRQVKALKRALLLLDPGIPLVLQPGNHARPRVIPRQALRGSGR